MVLLAKKHPHGLWERLREFASLDEAQKWLHERHDPTFRVFAPEDWEQLNEQGLTLDAFVAPRNVQVELEHLNRSTPDSQMFARLRLYRELEQQFRSQPLKDEIGTQFFVDQLMGAAFIVQPLLTEGEFGRVAQAAMARVRDALRREHEIEALAQQKEDTKK